MDVPILGASPLRRRWWPAVCLQSILLAGAGYRCCRIGNRAGIRRRSGTRRD